MATHGQFIEEDSDIVALLPDACKTERTGWVNIGVHAVHLHLTASGTLIIDSYARSQEDKILATMTIAKIDAVNAGGVDDDE